MSSSPAPATRTRIRAFVLGILLALLLAVAPSRLAAAERAPVPPKDALTSARANLKKEFRAELKGKSPADRRALAQVFLDRATEAGDDAARRYVFLEQATEMATDGRDVALALVATDRLASAFEVQRAAHGFAAVNGIARGSKDVGVLAEAASACIDLTGGALSEGDPATAGKAISAAKSLSKKAKMDGLGARAAALAKLVASFKRASAAKAATAAALEADASDAAAHAAAARLQCFGVGDWESGLGHFLLSDDAPLRALAELESQLDDGPEKRSELAAGWWAAAQSEQDPLARARMLARAAGHYEVVLPEATGDAADEVRERLESITYTAWNRGVALTTDFSKYGSPNLALASLRSFIAKQKIDKRESGWRTKLMRFPEITYTPGVDYFWRLETNQGEITIRFFADTAPQHVTNFLYLTEAGFFDGLTFHRVIPGFMAQGGDPTGSGSGGPGYFIDGEYDSDRKHDEPGVLSMANTGQPRSDGSQFFITFRPTPELNGKHTVFGKVVDGMKTVRKLEAQGSPGGAPKTKLVIERATVFMR